METPEQPFTIRYLWRGRIWTTVENGPDPETAGARFKRLHPNVKFISCENASLSGSDASAASGRSAAGDS